MISALEGPDIVHKKDPVYDALLCTGHRLCIISGPLRAETTTIFITGLHPVLIYQALPGPQLLK